MKKRFFSLFLILSMLLGLLPTVAFAEKDTGSANPVSASAFYRNPRYCDGTSAGATMSKDAKKSAQVRAETSADTYYGIAADGYCSDPEEIRQIIADEMAQRSTYIEIPVRLKDAFLGDNSLLELSLILFEDALAHNGIPNQGDYLQWSYKDLSYGYRGYIEYNEEHYATLTYEIFYYADAAQEAAVAAKLNVVMDSFRFTSTTDQYTKAKTIYQYICDNVSYDYEHVDTDYPLQYTAYGALIDGTAVCQGFATLFYRMALMAGLDARVITGDGGGPHAWNIVKIESLYYNLDSTWDNGWGAGYWDWFLLGNENFVSHYRDAEYTTDAFSAAYPTSDSDYAPVPKISLTTKPESGLPYLSWNAVDNSAVQYEIYRATSKNGYYTKLQTTSNTSFINTTAEAGKTYYYKIRVIKANGDTSDYSEIKSITCDLPQPTGVTLTNSAASGKPLLKWNAVDGAVKYEIYRCGTYGGTYTKYYTTTATTFTNSSVKAGQKYYYKVVAVASNTAANSAASKIVTVVCDLPQPTGVTLSNNATTGKPVLKWDAVEGAAGYEIYRSSTYDGTYTKYYTTTSTTFTNSAVKAGQKYYYKVRALSDNASANGALSKAVTIVCDLPQPTVSITTNTTTGKPVVSWNAVDGAVKYDIYRSATYDGTYTKYYTTTSTSFTNSAVKAGQKYYYKVVAVGSNTAANSALSKAVTIVCDCAKVNATISLNSNGKPVVKWDAVEGATAYEVYRCGTRNGTYTLYTTTKYTQFTNSGVGAGQQYFYKVRAIVSGNSSATGAYSNIVTIKAK